MLPDNPAVSPFDNPAMPFAAAYMLGAFQSGLSDLTPMCSKAVGKSSPIVKATIMANDLRPSKLGMPNVP